MTNLQKNISKQFEDFARLSSVDKAYLVWLILVWIWLLLIGLFSGKIGLINPIPELARVNVFMIWVSGLFMISLAQIFLVGRLPYISRQQKIIIGVILLLFIWLGVCSVLGTDLQQSLWGNPYRRDGLITLANLMLFAGLIGICWRYDIQQFFGRLVGWSGLITAIVYFFSSMLAKQSLVGFGSAIYLSGFLLITMPFVWFNFRGWLLKIITTGLMTAAILLTGVTGSILGIVVFFGLLLLSKLKRRAHVFQVLLLLTTIIMAVSIWTVVSQRDSYEGRPRVMTTLWLASNEQPLLGWGYANVDQAFVAVDWPYPVGFDVYVDKAHANLLEMLVVAGWPGLIMYISLLALIVYHLWWQVLHKKPINPFHFAVATALLLYIFHSQTNVISITEEIIFWFCVGVILSLIGDSQPSATGS